MTKLTESHSKAYVCRHVFDGSAPVLLVSRADGDWSFLCGAVHPDVASEYRVVGIGHVFSKDASLGELEDLPAEWEAERTSVGDEWHRTQVR